jgi:thiamine biosynthesis lipoprotein
MNRAGLLAAGLLLAGCSRDPLAVHSFSKDLMHGTWDLQVVCRGRAQAETAVDAVCAEVSRLDTALSPWLPGSELARANAGGGSAEGVTLSADLATALQWALAEARASEGAYDPSAGVLDQAWWQAGQAGRPLSQAQRLQGLGLRDWRQVQFDPHSRRLRLLRPGMRLDLSSLAKGYAQDSAALILKAHGIKSFLLNAGGQVYAAGDKPDGSAWRVGILDPRDSSKVAATLSLQDEVLSTHGDSAELSAAHGQPAPVTLDPRTGRAAVHGLASVSAVLAWDPQGHAALRVELVSLSALVLGPRDGLHWLGAQDAEGVLIEQKGAAWQAVVTPGLRARLQASDTDIAFPGLSPTHP